MIIGIGVDITEIARIRQALARTPRLYTAVFTEAERAYAEKKGGPAASYALMFAAKESAFKALHMSGCAPRWTELELWHSEDGIPELRLHGSMAERAEELGIEKWHISCSHSDEQAICFCIAEGGLKG